MTEETEVKRGPGRPRKVMAPKVEPKQESKRSVMRAKPNWDDVDPNAEVSVDRYKLPREFLDKWREYSFQWVTHSVFGQEDPQHRGVFEQGGWTPVHQDDFDGELNGRFMKKHDPNEINVGGQVLMARPRYLTEKALAADKRAARDQVLIKEQALRGGDMPVTLDARHATAINSNRISKSIERIEIPEK